MILLNSEKQCIYMYKGRRRRRRRRRMAGRRMKGRRGKQQQAYTFTSEQQQAYTFTPEQQQADTFTPEQQQHPSVSGGGDVADRGIYATAGFNYEHTCNLCQCTADEICHWIRQIIYLK
jgi:hypothetical protein